MKYEIRFIVTTGLLIAVTVVFQSLSKFVSFGPWGNFITGSLVNACLMISTSLTGLWGGATVGIITPFCAILTRSAIPPLFAPFIAVGNFSLIFFYHFIRKNQLLRLIVPAMIKTMFLYLSICSMLDLLKLPIGQAKMMLYLFSWPQLVTALIGGFLALSVQKKLQLLMNKTNKTR